MPFRGIESCCNDERKYDAKKNAKTGRALKRKKGIKIII
jgi:hypothetical protein